MTPAERDALAMSPDGFPGLGLDADHADMLRPGVVWVAEHQQRVDALAKVRAGQALRDLLASLTPEDRVTLAREVLGG